MATATTASKSERHFGVGIVRRPKGYPAPAKPADTCRMVLEIRDVPYRVVRLKVQNTEVFGAYRLKKLGSADAYDVHRDAHGLHCTCGDGVFRKEGTAELCKHARALAAWDLI
jgi:hypothetical protein